MFSLYTGQRQAAVKAFLFIQTEAGSLELLYICVDTEF